MTLKKQNKTNLDILSQSIASPIETELQTSQIEQILTQAIQHQQAGQLPEAERLLKQILQLQPEHAEAWHILGIIAHTVGKSEMAIELIERAINFQSNTALFHANLGEIYRLTGNLDKAVQHGQRAVQLDLNMVAAHANLGIAYYDLEQFEQAKSCQESALKINPNFPSALNNMGSILKETENLEGAAEYYRRSAEAAPDYIEPVNNLGAIFVKMEKPKDALKILDNILMQVPHYPEAHCNKGNALLSLEQNDNAIVSFQKSLQLRSDYPEAYVGLARVYIEQHQLEEAEKFALKAVELMPDQAENLSVLGTVYLRQGRSDEAKEKFDTALTEKSNQPSAKLGLGQIAMEAGNFEKAEDIFRSLLDIPNERISSLSSLTQVRKIKKDDDIIPLLEQEFENIESLSEAKSMYLHFALGKAYDDVGEAHKAFPHFKNGCEIKRTKIEYDADAKDLEFERIQKIFSRSFIKGLKGSGNTSDRPIFIVGMPRSGTTLTEQIIASHPSVFGAGELNDFINIANWNGLRSEETFPENMPSLTPQKLKEIGDEYIKSLEKINYSNTRVTDKMPGNFVNIGLIHLALPNAKIIHVLRDPLDTCLSCYMRMFMNGQHNTYDLKELGRSYKNYNKLMMHWKNILPDGSFYNIQYEDLINNTENETRALLKYCDLKWDKNCLEFYKTKRNIRTASVSQVRKPIYTSSINKSDNYREFLTPLIDELSDL